MAQIAHRLRSLAAFRAPTGQCRTICNSSPRESKDTGICRMCTYTCNQITHMKKTKENKTKTKNEVTHNIFILFSYNTFSTYMCVCGHWHTYKTINVLRVLHGMIKHRQAFIRLWHYSLTKPNYQLCVLGYFMI